MKFLVDAQLPPLLCDWLRVRGAEAVHVSQILSGEATDSEIADRALAEELIVITKDDDFVSRYGRQQPRVVWLRIGNASNRRLAVWLDERWAAIIEALDSGETVIEVR